MRVRYRRWVPILTGLASLVGCGAGSISTTSTTDSAPGAGIFGRVLDEESQPVADAVIELRDDGDTLIGQPVRTDANGEFRIDFGSQIPPESAQLHIRPPNRPQTQAPVEVPHGAMVEVLVTLDQHGAATVKPVLEPPRGAVRLSGPPRELLAVRFDDRGNSEPFRLIIHGRFDPAAFDVRLIYRPPGAPWRVGSAPLRRMPEASPSLLLGPRAGELHGRTVEVRVVAAPAGRLDSIGSFERPDELGSGVVVNPRSLFIVPVVGRDNRLTNDGFGPGAIVAGGGRDGIALAADADLTALGLSPGERISLVRGRQTVSLRVETSAAPLIGLVTLQLSDRDAHQLGIELGHRHAGYTIRVEARGTR